MTEREQLAALLKAEGWVCMYKAKDLALDALLAHGVSLSGENGLRAAAQRLVDEWARIKYGDQTGTVYQRTDHLVDELAAALAGDLLSPAGTEQKRPKRVWTVSKEPDTDGEFAVGLLYVGAVLYFEDVRIATKVARDLNRLELHLSVSPPAEQDS